MTKEQMMQVILLREKGNSYSQISDVLGISKNTIKSYCQRHSISVNPAASSSTLMGRDFCRECGKQLPKIEKRKPKKFCCSECRVKWWNSHLDQVKKKAIYSFTCACCGKDFSAYGNSHRVYCSHACYIDARFKGGGSS